MDKDKSIDPFNSPEFEFIKTTLNNMLYGKWWKLNTRILSIAQILKFAAFYLPIIVLELWSITNVKLFGNPNRMSYEMSVTVLFISQTVIYIVLTRNRYSAKDFEPATSKLIEDNYLLSSKSLDYKLLYGKDLRFNRLGALFVSIAMICFVYIICNPTASLLLIMGFYKLVDMTDFKSNLHASNLVLFLMTCNNALSIIAIHFMYYELMILTPFVLSWVNNRYKHLGLVFAYFLLSRIVNLLIVRYHPEFSLDYLLVIPWIVALVARDIVLIRSRKHLRQETKPN